MKTWLKLFVVISSLSLLIMAGCSEDQSSSDTKQKNQEEKMLQQATSQTGMPNITNFQERKQLKAILEARDTANLITYMYTQNEMDGKWVYQGEAIGFPIPYATEYTNPEKTVYGSYQDNFTTIPQADPNGLFSSQDTSGDWIMAVNPKTGQPEPQYMEPNVTVKESKIPANLCEAWSLPSNY